MSISEAISDRIYYLFERLTFYLTEIQISMCQHYIMKRKFKQCWSTNPPI